MSEVSYGYLVEAEKRIEALDAENKKLKQRIVEFEKSIHGTLLMKKDARIEELEAINKHHKRTIAAGEQLISVLKAESKSRREALKIAIDHMAPSHRAAVYDLVENKLLEGE